MRAFVNRGAPLDNANKDGFTPLHVAAISGKSEVVRYLIKLDTDINICALHSNTALHIAAYSGSVKSIKILLKEYLLT